jgi:hypothetical protein
LTEQETPLEQGWLLAELEQRFGYGLEELARRFDRSVSWVSRRLALVELLPESIQQQVREGKILAHVAMKYLVPAARINVEDCERMAAIFMEHHCETRQAGGLYAAWRKGSAVIRKRILDAPELFFRTQRHVEVKPPTTAATELIRDLEIVAAIVSRAQRRLAGAAALELDTQQGEAARQQVQRIQGQLRRIDEKILSEQEPHVEPNAADHDSGTAQPGGEQAGDREAAGNLATYSTQSGAVEGHAGAGVAAEPYRQRILDLISSCKGNLVRVHEELLAAGAELSYAALTAFCRRHGISQAPVTAAGRYEFEPGEEIQHDTSPHDVELGGKKRKVQTASGREMVPVPEMAAFAERFGFEFVAHAIGHANRSARVERPFWFIENNFLAGRKFSSWLDLNQQAREWCDKVNSTYKKHIRAVPRELLAVERLRLKPLPAWIPEVYRLHHRMVDVEGYVALHTNRYSVPVAWIGRRVEVRETKDKIEIQLDARNIVTHSRIAEAEHQRILLAAHRPPRGQGLARLQPHPEEKTILAAIPEIADYVAALKQRSRKVPGLALRQLLRLVREYPRKPLLAALAEAGRYGLYDLDRLERMILRRVAREYFLLDEGK